MIPDYQERLFARVLSIPSVISSCAELGIEGKHLIGMQGPFSTEINEAMLRQFQCSYLVTKDTGLAGGFPEKMEACQRCGVTPVIIGRPLQEEGLSLPGSKGISGKAVRPYPVTEGFSCRHRHGCGKNTDPGRKEGL